MKWALILLIFGEKDIYDEKIDQSFGSHIIAKYETIEECNSVASKMRVTYKNTRKQDEFIYLLSNQPMYRCAPIPKQ